MEVGDYAGRFGVAVQQPLGRRAKVLLMVLQVVKLGKQPHCLKIISKVSFSKILSKASRVLIYWQIFNIESGLFENETIWVIFNRNAASCNPYAFKQESLRPLCHEWAQRRTNQT